MKKILASLFSILALAVLSAGPVMAAGEGETCAHSSDCSTGTCAGDACYCDNNGGGAATEFFCAHRVGTNSACRTDHSKIVAGEDPNHVCQNGFTCVVTSDTTDLATDGRCQSTAPPASSGGTTAPARTDYSPASFHYNNPLGTTSIPDLVGRLIRSLLGVVGALFLAMFIYGGVLWSTAGGDPKQVQNAKTTLVNAVIGIIVIAFSYAIVSSIFTFAALVSSGGS